VCPEGIDIYKVTKFDKNYLYFRKRQLLKRNKSKKRKRKRRDNSSVTKTRKRPASISQRYSIVISCIEKCYNFVMNNLEY
jgi:hypothetical protein